MREAWAGCPCQAVTTTATLSSVDLAQDSGPLLSALHMHRPCMAPSGKRLAAQPGPLLIALVSCCPFRADFLVEKPPLFPI